MKGDHVHHRRKNNKVSRLNPCETETDTWFAGDGIKLRVISDMDQKMFESHSVRTLCNQAFVSFENENLVDNNNNWVIFNDRIVLRLQACSLVPRNAVFLDANQRRSLGGVESLEYVHIKKWNSPISSDIKCSQIWVTLHSSRTLHDNLLRFYKYSDNLAKVEKIIHKKFLGHVVTEGQNILLDTSRNDRSEFNIYDITITEIIGGKSGQGNLVRGLIDNNTIIRAFPGDLKAERLTRAVPINKWRHSFDFDLVKHESNQLGIGGLAVPLKTILEGVFGSGSLPLPHSSNLSLAHRLVKGVILYGPPGAGKTTLAENMKMVLGCTQPKYIKLDMSPKALRSLFGDAIRDQMINRSRGFLGIRNGGRNKLHLFILEGIDRLYMEDQPGILRALKERTATLMTLMDRLDNILIIGTTTKDIQDLNPKIMRVGRFELHVKIDLPNNSVRSDILSTLVQEATYTKKLITNDLDFQEIALWTNGYKLGQFYYLVYDALLNAKRRNAFEINGTGTKVCMNDFYMALKNRSSKIICPLNSLEVGKKLL